MGNKPGKKNPVDDWLKQQQQQEERLFRILLLGPGDSGKSTMLKQMKKIEEIHKTAAGTVDHSDSIPLIREAVLIYMHILCKSNQLLQSTEDVDNAIKQDIQISDNNTALRDYFAKTKITRFDTRDNEHGVVIESEDDKNNDEDEEISTLFETFVKLSQSHIKPLWNDNGIKNTLKYRAMFIDQIPDTAAYFLDKLDDIADENYNPSFDDYIRLRTKTSGAQICNAEIDLDQLTDNNSKRYGIFNFEFTDIGGQAAERNKWARVMNDQIRVVLFLVAISEYDLPCYEDINKRRMADALDAFRKLMTHNLGGKGPKFVQDKQVVVLFNKFDLLPQKLQEVPVSSIPEFSDFTYDEKESDVIDATLEYFEQKFVDVVNEILDENDSSNDPKHVKLLFNVDKQLTFYNSQALNTQLIQKLFHNIMLQVVTGNLEKMGMGGSESSLV